MVTEAGSYLRLIDFVSLNLRLKDLLGPVGPSRTCNESTEEEEEASSLGSGRYGTTHDFIRSSIQIEYDLANENYYTCEMFWLAVY